MRWNVGYFGIKDLFTIVNVLGGVFGIYFAGRDRPDLAGYAIFAGYFFGDALDGFVARLTRTGNRFGAEFDTVADSIAQGIAPAVVVHAAYERVGQDKLGLFLMGFMIVLAAIRQARFNVERFEFPLCYCGLPRTVSGYAAVSFANSTLFFRDTGVGLWLGAAFVAALAILNLVPVPYMTHRGTRKMQGYVKVFVGAFLVSPFVAFLLARPFTFDVLFVFLAGYAATAWIPVRPEERRAFYEEYRRWAVRIASR